MEYEEKDNIFEQEFGAYERAGFGGNVNEYLSDINMDEKQRAKSPEDRFIMNINAVATSLNISDSDKIKLFDMVESQKINNIAYRNPTAFILGYLASKDGSRVISKKEVEKVFDLLALQNNPGVKNPDVIRYLRFWLFLKGNLDHVQIVE